MDEWINIILWVILIHEVRACNRCNVPLCYVSLHSCQTYSGKETGSALPNAPAQQPVLRAAVTSEECLTCAHNDPRGGRRRAPPPPGKGSAALRRLLSLPAPWLQSFQESGSGAESTPGNCVPPQRCVRSIRSICLFWWTRESESWRSPRKKGGREVVVFNCDRNLIGRY